MLLLPQIEYENEDWTLFNDYRYLRDAKADQKQITRFKTIILKAKNKRYYLYQH
jgi:hypothetical protein